jgi:hypothetical protein
VGLNIGNFSITQEGKFTHAGIMTGSWSKPGHRFLFF